MKLNKWLLGAMAFSLLTACSDNDLADKNVNGGEISKEETVSGYIAVAINLPEISSSTRGINDDYQDGLAREYNVDRAMILLFKGKDEKSSKFYRAKELKKPFFESLPENDNITSSYLAAIPVSGNYASDDKIFAMVIVNGYATITSEEDDVDGEGSTINIGGNDYSINNTFEQIINAPVKVAINSGVSGSETNFLMTNAPLSSKRGGGKQELDGTLSNNPFEEGKTFIHYLTELDKDKIKDTPDEAKENVAGCIYVERAAAKVTSTMRDGAIQIKFSDINDNGDVVELNREDIKVSATVRHALANTNNSMYIIRNVDLWSSESHFNWGLNTVIDGMYEYRMIGSKAMPKLEFPFHQEEPSLYRTYWGKDPNYENPMTDSEKEVKVPAVESFKQLSVPLYCRENTFTVQYMNHVNTTMAVYEVDLSITKEDNTAIDNLFVRDGDQSKVYLSERAAYAREISTLVQNQVIIDAMKKAVVNNPGADKEYSILKHLKFTFKVNNEILTLEDVNFQMAGNADEDAFFDATSAAKFKAELNAKVNDTEGAPTKLKRLLDDLNAFAEVSAYVGGKSYYSIPIKHFGDEYTPWDKTITGTSTSEVYNGNVSWGTPSPDHAAKYLGRYGMVRNNWYELDITKIERIGSTSIPDVTDNISDDNNEDKKYFAVEIHVLSWAKRTQQVDF